MRTYYQLLNITPQASQHEIRHAFRRLALKYHPDKNNALDASDKFRKILIAYETLSDPAKRTRYDLSLQHVFVDNAHQPPCSSGEVTYAYQLAKRYLPYFRWSCWVGLALTLLLAADYLLPVNRVKDKIVTMENIYRNIGGGVGIYDHTVLITDKGRVFTLSNSEISSFLNHKFIVVYITPLLFSTVAIRPEAGNHVVMTSLIYGNLFFVPLALLIISVLGILTYNRLEQALNFSIVSAVLLLIVLYLMVF